MGNLLFDNGKPAEAIKATRVSVAMLQKLVNEDSSVPAYQSALANSLRSLGEQVECDREAGRGDEGPGVGPGNRAEAG